MTSSSSSVSCGVSTAVGSSRISRSTSRTSALTISTRCCTPTGRSATSASGSTGRRYRSDTSSTRARALRRSSTPAIRVVSAPSITFSVTVNTGTSMKCWCTMPIPASIASPGPRNRRAVPSTTISPSSGCSSP